MPGSYDHTQKSPLAPLWVALALLCAATALYGGAFAGWAARTQVAFWLFALPFGILGFCFGSLRVRSDGERLQVRFGPLGFLGTSLRYDDVRGVSLGRSGWVDGWGMHWRPGHGWLFNLWGFDCVEIRTASRKLRIGSDDARGLARHLEARASLGAEASAPRA